MRFFLNIFLYLPSFSAVTNVLNKFECLPLIFRKVFVSDNSNSLYLDYVMIGIKEPFIKNEKSTIDVLIS